MHSATVNGKGGLNLKDSKEGSREDWREEREGIILYIFENYIIISKKKMEEVTNKDPLLWSVRTEFRFRNLLLYGSYLKPLCF